MSEFLAEASVLIVPDTTKFRALLLAQVRKAQEGVVVPIPVVAQAKGMQTVVNANKQAAATATQASVATKELNATRTRQIIEDREAAAEEAKLAQAQQLNAVAQGKLALVSAAAGKNTTELAIARAQLSAANKAVLAGESAVEAALVTTSEETQAAAVETLRLAVAEQVTADAAVREAVALKASGRAAAENAATHEAAAHGITATGLSLLGIRGATLSASTSFLIGAAAVTVLAKSVKEASSEQEAAARAEAIFGDQTKKLEKDASSYADTIGLSTAATLRFEASVGTALQTAGVGQDKIGGLSERLVKLAADLSAANHVPLEQTLKSLQLVIVGNARGLKQLNVEMTATQVNQEALRETGKKYTTDLTQQEKVLARINLLFADTANQQGAAAERIGSLAGQTNVLKANLANLSTDLGNVVTPAITALVSEIAATVKGFKQLIDIAKSVSPPVTTASGHMTTFGKVLHEAGDAAKVGLFIVPELLKELSSSSEDTTKKVGVLGVVMGLLRGELGKVQASFAATEAASRQMTFQTAINNIGKLQDKLLDLQFKGASPAKILANLREQVAAEQAAIAAATTVKEKTAHKVARNAAQDQINSIIAQQKAAGQKIADDAVAAAQKIQADAAAAAQIVQDLIQKADQSLVDAISGLAGNLDIPALRAAATKSLQDDVALENLRQANIKQRIVLARSITDVKLRTDTIHDLTVQLVTSQIAEKALNAQIAQNRQQRRANAFNLAATSIDLDISLAQTENNKQAEIAARKRRIALDVQREKAVRGDIIATKRLRNDIAEQNAAIRALNKELAKRNDAVKETQFLFLTARAGFVGNLLSNLIPTNVAAGTVGGGAGGGIGVSAVAGLGGGTPAGGTHLGSAVSTATQTHVAQKGASMSQMSTLIHVQRQMLTVLMRVVAQRTHPEATHQRTTQATATDTV